MKKTLEGIVVALFIVLLFVMFFTGFGAAIVFTPGYWKILTVIGCIGVLRLFGAWVEKAK